MKIALVTTTINIPEVLRLARACSPDVAFFVAGDQKTPIGWSLRDCGDPIFLSVEDQRDLGYACSDLIGWNTVSRRSIAILEALKWGADAIVVWDDDNLMMSTDYFDRFEMVLGVPFSGPKCTGNWFDVGRLLYPPSPHRGFPHAVVVANTVNFAVDAKVGVAAGICMGDPDISAVDRISMPRHVHFTSELLRAGIVVQPGTHTVFNSQNTAFLRELAPCFLMVPQWGRHDDIWASLIAQRIMRERGLHVHFGMPFCWQQRNPHNLLKDLDAEIFGMYHTAEFAELLDAVPIAGKSVIDDLRTLWGVIRQPTWMPDGVSALASAWLEDCERVL